MIRASPNGRCPTAAVITALNRSPRAVLFRARLLFVPFLPARTSPGSDTASACHGHGT